MRHRVAGVKLGRTPAHRRALLRNLVTALLEHEVVRTTDAKAKELRRWGGYTRVVKLAGRHGEAAALSVAELVERAGGKTEKAPAKKPARRRAPAKGKQPAPPRRRRAAAG